MALLRKQDLDSVVSIGENVPNEGYKTLATGFLVGFPVPQKTEQGGTLYSVFLVTNRHVFENKTKVILRFNLNEKGSKTYDLNLVDNGNRIWLAHSNPKVDIACISINVDLLKRDGIKFEFLPEERFAYLSQIESLGISQGDGIFVLGFPMGLSGIEQNYVIVRGGVIARLDPEIINTEAVFLVDSTIFPGNSGGPVILRPEIASLSDTKPVNQAFVLGVISQYITYSDVAVSKQTQLPRIVFIENTGLSKVVPIHFVKECAVALLPK